MYFRNIITGLNLLEEIQTTPAHLSSLPSIFPRNSSAQALATLIQSPNLNSQCSAVYVMPSGFFATSLNIIVQHNIVILRLPKNPRHNRQDETGDKNHSCFLGDVTVGDDCADEEE